MIRVVVAFVVLAAAVAATPVAASSRTWDVAAVIGDGGQRIGTAYKAGGVVRTAAHVADLARGIDWTGEIYGVSVVCRDVGTDSATLLTSAPLPDAEVGDIPPLSAEVTLIGFRLGRPAEVFTSTVFGFILQAKAESGKIIGPLLIIEFPRLAYGMSGGPVLYRNRIVATISLSDDNRIYAVPVTAAKCGMPPTR